MDGGDVRSRPKIAYENRYDCPFEDENSRVHGAQSGLKNMTGETEGNACKPGQFTPGLEHRSADLLLNGPSQRQNAHNGSVLIAPEIEKKYVHGVYDAIAPHFSSTRFAKWPKVAYFLDSLVPGSVVFDAGCGNGKYLGLNPQCFFVGCDLSYSLVSICVQRGHEVLAADTVHLPCRTGFCDAAISIAVLHHLSTEDRRKKALLELLRVVRSGGRVLITVWAVEQEDRSLLKKWTPLASKYTEEWVGNISTTANRIQPGVSLQRIQETNLLHDVFEEEGEFCEQEPKKNSDDVNTSKNQTEQQEYFVPWHLPYHRAEVRGASVAALASGLGKKDDEKGAIIYNRYYHVFVEGELERLVSNIVGIKIVDHFYDKSNWCIILEKL